MAPWIPKAVVIKQFGTTRCLGASTSRDGALAVAVQALPSLSSARLEAVERLVRVDGEQREAFLVKKI